MSTDRGRNGGRSMHGGTWRRPWAAVVVLCLGVAAACGSVGVASASPAPTGQATTQPWSPPPCHRPAAAPVPAVPVPGVPSDWTITSFDGTAIRAHWFPVPGAGAAHPAPTVLMGPGWGSPGETTSAPESVGQLTVTDLNRAGYNVLTWDPRGFGQSEGTIEVDSPSYEGRDVSRLVDWVAARPGVQLDGPGDPRLGMVGASYGGGIQFTTAARDCRVDAIVPEIAWHSLTTSLDKADTPKIGWANLLYAAAPAAHDDPHMTQAHRDSAADSTIDAADRQWFAGRGPGALVGHVRVPTLIVQGTVDTLFTLDEGVTNFRILSRAGVPVHMLWFCGGHGVCLTDQGDPNEVPAATLAWLSRWVKRDRSTDVGPRVDIIDQHGQRYPSDRYPLPAGPPITARGQGTLELVGTGGSGPAVVPSTAAGLVGSVAGAITPAKATNAVDVTIEGPGHPVLVVGAPQLRLTYRGSVPARGRPTRVFAQLVDAGSGLVVGNQITPVPVTLDGRTHTTTASLEIVAQALAPGQRLTLQLVATTVAYARPQLGGSVTFSRIGISLPVAKGVTPTR